MELLMQLLSFSPEELTAIKLSIRIATVAMLVSLPIGIAVAYVLARFKFPGKSVIDGIVLLRRHDLQPRLVEPFAQFSARILQRVMHAPEEYPSADTGRNGNLRGARADGRLQPAQAPRRPNDAISIAGAR